MAAAPARPVSAGNRDEFRVEVDRILDKITSQGFGAFNRFGAGAFAQPGTFPTNNAFAALNGFATPAFTTRSFAPSPFANVNNTFAASPAGTFAISTRNAYHPWSGTFTTREREVANTPFGTAMLTTREAYNPYTGTFGFHTREGFVPSAFGSAFASPWTSSNWGFQNPNAMNPYAMNPYAVNPYAMNPYATNPYTSVNPSANWAANPNLWANANAGNAWTYPGFGDCPYGNPYAFGTVAAP